MTQYAVNVMDLTTIGTIGNMLIAPVILSKKIIDANPKMIDGNAVILDCDEERAKCIIHVMTISTKCRWYKCEKKAWKKISRAELLKY